MEWSRDGHASNGSQSLPARVHGMGDVFAGAIVPVVIDVDPLHGAASHNNSGKQVFSLFYRQFVFEVKKNLC